MRRPVAAALVLLIAVSGQAAAKTSATAPVVAVRAGDRVGAPSANANQLLGMGLWTTLLIAAAGITLFSFAATDNSAKSTSP